MLAKRSTMLNFEFGICNSELGMAPNSKLHGPNSICPRPRRQALDPLLVPCALNEAIDIDRRRADAIRIQLPDLDQLLDLGHTDLPGGRHHGVEVAGGHAEHEVAALVALLRLDDAEV